MSSREEFEAWYQKDVCSWSNLSIDSNGEYFGQMARTAWKSWQASRQAMEIVLPARMNENTQSYERDLANMAFNEAVEECREAIEASGVRLKP